MGLVTDDQVIVSAADYNDAELMLDDEHYGEPYKRMVRTFVIPDDAESEEKVQTYGFKMLVGTHMLPKEDYPFRVYSITLYNISTDTVIMYADADSLNTTAAQGARELMVDDSILGGIVGKRANGYGDATLVNGGFETLPAGMYSYDFNYTTLGNNGSEKATISAVTEDGEVLNSRVITDYYNGVYKTNRLTFYVDEETRVGFKIDLHNNTDFYLKNVTLNQMLSAEEVAIHRVITAIEELPAVDALTLDDAGAVSSAKKLYDNLSDEQKAAIDISNVNKLNQAVEKIAQLEEQLERDKEAAAKVDEAINALPSLKDLAKADQSKIKEARDAYNALTDTQKPLVTTLSVLEAAEARMEKLLAASDEDISAAKAVDDMIDALPAEDELEYADKADVDAARAAYDKLTEAQKGLVLGLETLKAAEEKIADLAPDVTYGDVNNDGKIDASDALEALQHSVELKTLEGDAFTAADVTNDSKVDATDALNILQYSVELIDHFPVEE